MSNSIFDYLCQLSDLVSERGAAVPQLKELEKDWHGAAFDLLGTRCVISADETRMIVDLGDTIPLPGVKHWVRGLANVGGRFLQRFFGEVALLKQGSLTVTQFFKALFERLGGRFFAFSGNRVIVGQAG